MELLNPGNLDSNPKIKARVEARAEAFMRVASEAAVERLLVTLN